MADYIHQEKYLKHGDQVILQSANQACNFMIMDGTNYNYYRQGKQFRYYGGSCTQVPSYITVPHATNWHVVADLGGRGGRLSVSIGYITN